MDIIDILSGDGYIIFNKEFAKKYGLEASILLGAMCGYQKGFRNEYFYREQSKILDDTTLTAYALRSSIKILQGLGIIEYEKRGMPAKYYYKVNVENLERVIDFRKSRVNENANSRDCKIVNSCVNENNSTYNNNDKNENKNNKADCAALVNEFFNSEPVKSAIITWLDYKKENHQEYKPTGLKVLLNRLKKESDTFGEQYVIDEIEHSIGNRYAGIFAKKEYQTRKKQEFQRHKYSLEILQEQETSIEEF
jgi:hypothetical protein